MLSALLGALAVAPIYWLLTPPRYRRDVLAIASLAALVVYDALQAVALFALCGLLFAGIRAIGQTGSLRTRALLVSSFVALVALFAWNKLGGIGAGTLPSQGGLLFLGMSYFVLKAAAVMIEVSRGSLGTVNFRTLLAWIVFLPTYPSGPIEEFSHFRDQQPVMNRARVLTGLERILVGLGKALVLSHYLGAWALPILEAPQGHSVTDLILAMYAFTLRFYFDFAGYSDVAIGVAAVFGYEIQENFDNPLIRRNLVKLWQHWHMTLTRWLRLYLFIPASRSIMRRAGRRFDSSAILAAQLLTMTFCGLWHGLGWNFVLWGVLQALGLIWVGVYARDAARILPTALVGWWRRSRTAYVLSTFITFNAFALSNILVASKLDQALAFFTALIAA